MKISRFALLGAVLVATVGCRDSSTDPTTPIIPDLAYIRYINAVPDTNNTTFRFIDQLRFVPLTFVNVPYRGLAQGNYQGVRLDAHKIRVFTADFSGFTDAGNTTILVDTTLTFEKGKYYTILHTGYARAGQLPKQKLQVIEDALPTPGSSVAIRFINSGLNMPAMDFYALPTTATPVTGTPTQAALAAGAMSAYLTRATAQFSVVTTAVGSGALVPGSVLTAIAFPASVSGSKAAAAAAPSVVYYLDKQPPRFSTP